MVGRISPPSPTSPNTTVEPISGLLNKLERIAADDREIGCRFFHLQAADDIEIDILIPEIHSETLLQHRGQQRQPLRIDAGRQPARRTEMRPRNQRLNLDQQRP